MGATNELNVAPRLDAKFSAMVILYYPSLMRVQKCPVAQMTLRCPKPDRPTCLCSESLTLVALPGIVMAPIPAGEHHRRTEYEYSEHDGMSNSTENAPGTVTHPLFVVARGGDEKIHFTFNPR